MRLIFVMFMWVLSTVATAVPYQLQFIQDGHSKEIKLPHIWTQDPALKNLQQGQYELIIPPWGASDDLALLINPKHTQNTIVYQVFRNEQEIFRFGNPEEPDRLTDLIIPGKPILIKASQEPVTLKIVVTTNRHTLLPGIHKIILEPAQQYERRAYLDALIAVGLMGAIVIVAFYHAMLWLLNRKERNQILFVAFCMMVLIFAGLHVSQVFFQFYSINVHLYWMLQSLAWFGSVVFVDAFSYAMFPKEYPLKKVRVTLSIAILCWMGNFFSLYSMLVFQVYSWIFLGHIVVFASRLARTPKRENLLFTLIYTLLITGTLIDLASGIDLLNVPSLMPLCFFGIICIESYLLSYVNQQTSQRLMKEQMQRQEVEESMLAVQGLRERIDQSDQIIPGLHIHSYYRPAARFGGDWLSLTYLSEARHGIILVGDVTGHGMGSGLLAVSIGATIHGALSVLESMGKSLTVEEKLDYIAQAIHYAVMDISKRLNKGMTLALIGMDLEKGYCVVRNHGHPFPYLMRDDAVKIVMARGSLLGTEELPSADVVRLEFQPGDKIFVYTDGLMENRNGEGKVLPRRELERTLRAVARDEKHIEQFEQYTHAATDDAQDADDLAYLYLEWEKAS
jgi:serine phosphatase RsbU (regulator of sigma subunit)